MLGYDREEAARFILSHLDVKPFRAIADRLPRIIGEMIDYDLQFMRQAGVIDEQGAQGPNEYDDDEAFEYIYEAWLGDNPGQDDDDMMVAALLDRYMELQYRFLCEQGLAEL